MAKKNLIEKALSTFVALSLVMAQMPTTAFAGFDADGLDPNQTNTSDFGTTQTDANTASVDEICGMVGAPGYENKKPANSPTLPNTREALVQCSLRSNGNTEAFSHTGFKDDQGNSAHLSAWNTDPRITQAVKSGSFMQDGKVCKYVPASADPNSSCPGKQVAVRACMSIEAAPEGSNPTMPAFNPNDPGVSFQSCDEARKETSGCQLAYAGDTKQVKLWCQARKDAKKAKVADGIMTGLNAVAAGLCTSACVADLSGIGAAAGKALEQSCSIAGMAITVGELANTIAAQAGAKHAGGANYKVEKCTNPDPASEECQKITETNQKNAINWSISGIGAAGVTLGSFALKGAGTAVSGASKAVTTANGSLTNAQSAFDALHNAPAGTDVSGKLPGAAKDLQDAKDGVTKAQNTKKASDKQKAMVCLTAVMYDVMLGMRASSLANDNKITKKADEVIMTLMSPKKSTGDGNSSSAGNGNGSGGGSGGIYGSGYASGTGAPGGNTTGGSGNGGSWGNNGIGMLGDGTLTFGATDASGLDAKSFKRTKMGGEALKAMQKIGLTPAKVEQMLASGGAAGVASGVAGALGLSGKYGQELAAIAGKAQRDFSAVADTQYASGGGASRTVAATTEQNPFSLGATGSLNTGANLNFEQPQKLAEPDDIFHSNSSDNIFQIVSKRIAVTGDRVK